MRVSDALVLSSILGMVACATQVPIDMDVLLATADAGFADAGFGAFGNGSGGFTSGFPSAGGSTPLFPMRTGGTGPRGAGGSPPMPAQNAGGRMAMPPPPPPAAGGRSSTGAGGATSKGGASTGAGGGDCRSGEKVCGGVCVSPAPRTGCGLTGCDACTIAAPANGVVICNASHQCEVSCLSGFTKNGSTCEGPPPGAGGSTGGGVPTGQCGGTSCPSCSVILGPSCCTTAGKCGCPLVPWTAGFLGCI
jgi:hypothetical protein